VYDTIIKNGEGSFQPVKASVTPSATGPVRGSGAVTIVEFADFQCPYCRRAEDAMKEILKNYPGKVKIVWRNLPLPFHPHAPLAAEAALEARAQKGDAGFYKMHELLIASPTLERSDLDSFAQKIGLDLTRFKNALDGHTHQSEMDTDAAAAKAAGVTGTPGFFVGSYVVNGAQPYEKFRRLIDLVIKESKP